MNPVVTIATVFLGVFIVVILVMLLAGGSKAKESKELMASLEAVLATESQETRAQILDLRKSEQMSAIPWLNQRLMNFQLTPYFYKLLKQANSNWSPGGLLTMCAAAFVVGGYLVYLRTDGLLPALGVGVASGLTPIWWVNRQRTKRFQKFEQALPEAIDLMVGGLRAGHSLVATMGLVARECADPVASEFRICFEEQNYGLEMKIALDNLTERMPLQDLRIVTTAINIQRESGGNLAEVLDKTAHTIRERFRLRRQVRVHSSQGRLTGVILTLLPVAMGVILYFVNPVMMSILWTRAIGIKLLWTALGMVTAGGLIIRKIVNMDV
jgi:tight adherence protein B